jgi:hypothetical protein
MKNYDGILILEPEDTYNKMVSEGSYELTIRGGNQPLYGANMVIAKRYLGDLTCLKSRERSQISYTQSELREIVDRCENPIDMNLLLMF